MPGWISLENKPRLPQSSAEMQVGLESSMVIHLACFLSTKNPTNDSNKSDHQNAPPAKDVHRAILANLTPH